MVEAEDLVSPAKTSPSKLRRTAASEDVDTLLGPSDTEEATNNL